MLRARSRLADMVEPDGRCPAGTPFYSTAAVPRNRFPAGVLTRMMLGMRRGQFVWVGDEIHAGPLYFDEHRMISTSLAALALSNLPDHLEDVPRRRDSCRPRYRCADHMEYIVDHALPLYIA